MDGTIAARGQMSRGRMSTRMKLIVSHLEALRRYVSREFYYIMSDLIANHGWVQIDTDKLWRIPGTIKDALVNEFGQLPATILFWEGYELINARAAEIHRLECRKFLVADDLHWWNEEMREKRLGSFRLCETVLSTYAYVWDRFYPELPSAERVLWIPHSASPDFMLGYSQHPENSILLSGAINHHYPLRQEMQTLHTQRSYAIAYHAHPGYHCWYNYAENTDVGRGYAERINKCRAGFAESSKYGYLVAKYFEIPATGALLLADAAVSEPLKELGFIENEHYLPVTKEDLEDRVRYVLDERNHKELDEIRKRGQELVWERHKTSDRAKQINDACDGKG